MRYLIDLFRQNEDQNYPQTTYRTDNTDIKSKSVQFVDVLRRIRVGNSDHFRRHEHQRRRYKRAGNHSTGNLQFLENFSQNTNTSIQTIDICLFVGRIRIKF